DAVDAPEGREVVVRGIVVEEGQHAADRVVDLVVVRAEDVLLARLERQQVRVRLEVAGQLHHLLAALEPVLLRSLLLLVTGGLIHRLAGLRRSSALGIRTLVLLLPAQERSTGLLGLLGLRLMFCLCTRARALLERELVYRLDSVVRDV